MHRRLKILPAARQEFKDARLYLEREAPGTGHAFASLVQESFDAMLHNPEAFAFVETLSSRFGYRRALLRKYRYTIVFKVIGENVTVVAAAHTSRRPNYWIDRR